jgi:hypothetical protein
MQARGACLCESTRAEGEGLGEGEGEGGGGEVVLEEGDEVVGFVGFVEGGEGGRGVVEEGGEEFEDFPAHSGSALDEGGEAGDDDGAGLGDGEEVALSFSF